MAARIFFMIILVIAICAFTTSATATIWRVDSNPSNEADFRTLSAAHSGAQSGDTLYVMGSGVRYGSLTLTKKLFIFGPGYFLDQNPNTQARPVSAKGDNINFNSGSNGSLFTGLEVREVTIGVSVKNITIKRNRIVYSTSGNILLIHSSASNSSILQNYIQNTNSNTAADAIDVNSSVQGVLIANNFIDIPTTGDAIEAHSSALLDVKNNVIRGRVLVYNSIFHNNILRDDSFSGSFNSVFNNIANGTQFAAFDATNQSNVDMATVFVDTTSSDGRWQLETGSPAIGAGTQGVDVGMFGGENSYVLSGIPTIPAIYFFASPPAGSNTSGLSIQMKVKSQD